MKKIQPTLRNAFRKFSDKKAYSNGLIHDEVYASACDIICNAILKWVSAVNRRQLFNTKITCEKEEKSIIIDFYDPALNEFSCLDMNVYVSEHNCQIFVFGNKSFCPLF
jgi:hypothetical protein